MRHVAIISLFMALSLPHVAQAAETAPPLWNKTCGKDQNDKPSCVVEQFALAMPQKAIVLRVRFALMDRKDQTSMTLTAPLGTLLTSGLTLSIDGSKPIALPYERCVATGCDASAVLEKTALEKFEKGKTLIVRYAAANQGAVDIPIRLEGLTNALTSLSK